MTKGTDSQPRRWAPEWIAVLTLAVTIIALGGAMLASMHAMETRIRDDMRAMEFRIREDTGEIRRDIGMLRERVSSLDEKVTGLDNKVAKLDEKVAGLDRRVSRLEARFDEEFPRRHSGAHDARAAPAVAGGHRL